MQIKLELFNNKTIGKNSVTMLNAQKIQEIIKRVGISQLKRLIGILSKAYHISLSYYKGNLMKSY